jgi:hypothetical protein
LTFIVPCRWTDWITKIEGGKEAVRHFHSAAYLLSSRRSV